MTAGSVAREHQEKGGKMNEAQFLIRLGMNPSEEPKAGLACPAIIGSPKRMGPSAMIETADQVGAHIDINRGVAGRATPRRQPGAAQV